MLALWVRNEGCDIERIVGTYNEVPDFDSLVLGASHQNWVSEERGEVESRDGFLVAPELSD